MIVAGGGAIYAGARTALAAFAEAVGAPVLETQAGKGALAWDHPLTLGPVGANGGQEANALARDADLVVCVGTRLSDFTTASMTAFAHPQVRFVGVNVAPFDAHKLGALALVADARAALEALTAAVGRQERIAYRAEIAARKHAWDALVTHLRSPHQNGFGQAEVMGIVNDAVGGDAVVINAAGSMPGDLLKLWRPTHPHAYHVEYGFSCMGYEIAAGLGVKLADPARDVVVFVGDGSYLMMNSDLYSSVLAGHKLIVIVCDNGGFAVIHRLQTNQGGAGYNNLIADTRNTGEVYVDFAAHARSMGCEAETVSTIAELDAAFERARASERTYVIAMKTSDHDWTEGGTFWEVGVPEVSNRPAVRDAKSAMNQGKQTQRLV